MASGSRGWRAALGFGRASRGAFPDAPARPFRRTALRDAQGRSVVGRSRSRDDVAAALRQAISHVAEDRRLLAGGESPLILPRFGTGPAPRSTAPDFLVAVIHTLREHGAGHVRVLDARGPAYDEPSGLAETCRELDAELIDVRDGPWVRADLGEGRGTATVPLVAYEADRLVLLPTPLANKTTRFSLGLALAQQLLLPGERMGFLRQRREERLVELNRAVRPWLLLMDARKALVGDEEGDVVREPGYVFASGDPIALDVQALKLLKGYPAKNRLAGSAWASPQITAAVTLGLGADREDETRLIEG